MTETQAKSGVAGASTPPGDEPGEAPPSAKADDAEATAVIRPEGSAESTPTSTNPSGSGSSTGSGSAPAASSASIVPAAPAVVRAPSFGTLASVRPSPSDSGPTAAEASPDGSAKDRPGGAEVTEKIPSGAAGSGAAASGAASTSAPTGGGPMTGPTAVNRPSVAPAVATAQVSRPVPTPVAGTGAPGVKPPEPTPTTPSAPPAPSPVAGAKTPEPTPVSRASEATIRIAPPAAASAAPTSSAVAPTSSAAAAPATTVPVVAGAPTPPSAVGTVTGSHPVIATVSAPVHPSAPTTASGGAGPVPSAPVIARATVAGAGSTTLTRPSAPPPSTTSTAVGAARVSDAVRTARATVAGAAVRGPRRARLHLKRIDPWSVMKFSFAVSLVLFVVAIVATSVLYLALDAMGVFTSINKALGDMVGEGSTDAFKITAKGVIGTSVLLGAVNMVLFTALATLAAFVYNVCADLVGGVELTLSEKD